MARRRFRRRTIRARRPRGGTSGERFRWCCRRRMAMRIARCIAHAIAQGSLLVIATGDRAAAETPLGGSGATRATARGARRGGPAACDRARSPPACGSATSSRPGCDRWCRRPPSRPRRISRSIAKRDPKPDPKSDTAKRDGGKRDAGKPEAAKPDAARPDPRSRIPRSQVTRRRAARRSTRGSRGRARRHGRPRTPR